jgi:hypothetical protein
MVAAVLFKSGKRKEKKSRSEIMLHTARAFIALLRLLFNFFHLNVYLSNQASLDFDFVLSLSLTATETADSLFFFLLVVYSSKQQTQ